MATKTRQLADFLQEGGVQDIAVQQNPHIQPGTLQPAVAGKLLDGATTHSGNYGTAQSDGHSYYYTDIKGSRPIKDPRIGAHFGCQRHPIRSVQILEQETATHGEDIYSIDGKEYFRTWGKNLVKINDSNGEYIHFDTSNHGYVEIVGYLSGLNMHIQTLNNTGMVYKIDGGSFSAEQTNSQTTITSPLRGRYVNAASIINVFSDQTLGIHTVQLRTHAAADDWYLHGIELIAQDTSSTANKSKIQIPAQNVVSYGKKFSVSAATPHYNPFAQNQAGTAVAIGNTTSHGSVATGWAGTGAGYYDDTLDTATSLGLSAWVQNGKYYRPVNGGRVVKWVDSSGNIKTSVNMMPPTGTSIGVSSATNTPEANSWTTQYQPLFSSTTIDHSQAEVAKTFHFREFGNGAANQGNNTSGTLQDASMLSGVDDIAYVMDDGLTSLSANGVYGGEQGMRLNSNPSNIYITFIGTGITFEAYATGGHGGSDDFNWYLDGIELKGWSSGNPAGTHTLAQNLPYGTHIVRLNRVTANTMWQEIKENVTFHQPKKPPIPEDACILADYMLMADFVPQTAVGDQYISKGTRSVSCSRDFIHTGSSNHSIGQQTEGGMGFAAFDVAESGGTWKLWNFGTNFVLRGFQSQSRHDLYVDGTDTASTSDNTAAYGTFNYITTSYELGTHLSEHRRITSNCNWSVYNVVTPIHTSSHYQEFETPMLKELLGGDRNMEQTNLICSSEGKTWDQVTRDTSYIGNVVLQLSADVGEVDYNVKVLFDECRGFKTDTDKAINTFNKDFAIAYDRVICLVDGEYRVHFNSICMAGNNQNQISIYLNGNVVSKGYGNNSTWGKGVAEACVHLKRDDQIYIQGGYWDNGGVGHSGFYIERLK